MKADLDAVFIVFRERKALSMHETCFKIVAWTDGATIIARMLKKVSKYEKMSAKFTTAIIEAN